MNTIRRLGALALSIAVILGNSNCGAPPAPADPQNQLPNDGFNSCSIWIAGTVRDASTRAVIPSRTAVAIESGYPTPRVETILHPGSDGKFSFCALQMEYVVVGVAADAQGNYYAPAVQFVSSLPAEGIELLLGSPTTGAAYLAGPVSTDKTNVSLRVYPVISLGADVTDRQGTVLLPVLTSTGYVDLNAAAGACAAPGCVAYQLVVPSQQPSVYSYSTWRRSSLPLLYSAQINASACVPSQRTATPVPSSGTPYAAPGVTLPMAPIAFTGCG